MRERKHAKAGTTTENHGRLTNSTQFGFFPTGYDFNLVSAPLLGSIP